MPAAMQLKRPVGRHQAGAAHEIGHRAADKRLELDVALRRDLGTRRAACAREA